MFCVVCGKETPLEELRAGVCATCYLDKHELARLKGNVDVEVCVHCHARKRGELWVDGGQESLEPVVLEAVREAVDFEKQVDGPRMHISVVPEDERNFSVTVEASGVAEGVDFSKKLVTRSRVKNATCLRCSRVQGGYYEAIVQVRATKRGIAKEEMRALRAMASRFIDRVVAEGDRNAFVLRDEEVDRGLDVYMGTTNSGRMLAKQISQEHGGKVTEHAKTVGQKDGLDLIRMTFAVRLPEYRAGDILILDETPTRVTSVGPKTVQVLDMRSGRARHVERADADRALVLSPDDARDAVVVSQTDREMQLLDPWSFATVSVVKPPSLETAGESVRVLRYDGELIVLV